MDYECWLCILLETGIMRILPQLEKYGQIPYVTKMGCLVQLHKQMSLWEYFEEMCEEKMLTNVLD